MLTAIVSDLHLGSRSERDLLRTPEAREALLAGVAEADRLVLLGDVVELREAPLGDALDTARPFFDALGDAFAGRQVVITAGNHDHQLAHSLIDRRRLDGRRALALDERTAPPADGPLGRIASWMPRVELELAYPGMWLRDDVYAMHGHYMDCHNTVPSLERLGAALAERVIGGLPEGSRTPDDYEAALAPIYALTYSLAQGPRVSRVVGPGTSVQVWQRLNRDSGRHGLATKVLGSAVLPAAVALLNKALPGKFSADVSGAELRRAGLRGIGEAVRRLGIDAAHVIYGHTHRAGPFARDEPWEVEGTGTRLVNSGSWIWEPAFVGDEGRRNPYFPGVCVFVGDSGPPRVERLLSELPDGFG